MSVAAAGIVRPFGNHTRAPGGVEVLVGREGEHLTFGEWVMKKKLAEWITFRTVQDGAPGACAFSMSVDEKSADVVVEEVPAGGTFGGVVTNRYWPRERIIFENDEILVLVEKRGPDGHLTEFVFRGGTGQGIFAEHPEFLPIFGEHEGNELCGEFGVRGAAEHGDGVGVNHRSCFWKNEGEAFGAGDGDCVPRIDIDHRTRSDVAEHDVFGHRGCALGEATGIARHSSDNAHAMVKTVNLKDNFIHHVDGAGFAEVRGADP